MQLLQELNDVVPMYYDFVGAILMNLVHKHKPCGSVYLSGREHLYRTV